MFPDGPSFASFEESPVWRLSTLPRAAIQSDGGAQVEVFASLSGKVWTLFTTLDEGDVGIHQLPRQIGHIQLKRDDTGDPVQVTLLATYDQV